MRPAYTLDGVPCFSLDMVDIPAGCCEVDVMIEGMEYAMVAGNVASRVSASDTICTGRERWVGHAEPRFTVVYVCKEMMWDADKLIGEILESMDENPILTLTFRRHVLVFANIALCPIRSLE